MKTSVDFLSADYCPVFGPRSRRTGQTQSDRQVPGLRDVCRQVSCFVAEFIFKDGSYAVFDGAKDMFKYYLNMGAYDASRKKEDIESVYVTDYYSLGPIDGLKARYVIGKRRYRTDGAELFPFEKEEDAAEFNRRSRRAKTARFPTK